ncbi:adenylate/guanylate cyclase domain-containing protein [Geodermatophilus sp. SYSU D00758]
MDAGIARQVLQCLGEAVAVVDPGTLVVEFENARFFNWFPPTQADEDTVTGRIPGFPAERAVSRLAAGRSFSHDVELKEGARSVSVRLGVRSIDLDGESRLLVEGVDVSKQMEAEYMLDSYSKMVERNTRELQREKERVEKLLLNIMPRTVFNEMTEYGTVTPQRFDNASILMLDFVGFTSMTVSRDPGALIAELNDIFTGFDRIVELFGCERLKTIGDAYVAVAGLPDPSPDHARDIARVALRMRRFIDKRNASHVEQWSCRIGLNTGPVIGSIVGVQKYVYDVFGPGVNLASRMETAAEPGTIAVSEPMFELLRNDFVLSDQGEVEIKGFGPQRVYHLESEPPRR